MTTSKLVLVIAAAFLLVGANAYGQTASLQANVPFSFQAAGKALPAGLYAVEKASNQSGLLLKISNLRTAASAYLMVRYPAETRKVNHAELRFYCIDQRCTLQKVCLGNSRGWVVAKAPASIEGKLYQASVRLEPARGSE
jgi:type IV secretory pathway protease TraF